MLAALLLGICLSTCLCDFLLGQVADGLHFLHTEANQVHRALCPHTVFITTMGAWKLGGLSLACPAFITAETTGVVPVSYRDPSMERFMRYQQVLHCPTVDTGL